MNTLEPLKFDELIFVVLEHKDGIKAAFEGSLGLAVFGDTMGELTDKILLEVESYFNGDFNGSIRIREFKDTFVKVPIVSGEL